jgi:cell volume regulation protein A
MDGQVERARTCESPGRFADSVGGGEPGSLVGAHAAMPEITHFATLLLIVTAGFSLAVASTRLTERVPVPAPALFLVAAAVASDLWPSIYDRVPTRAVERVAVVALIVILFNGGSAMGWRRFRASAAPVLSLGVPGTFATAAALALTARVALGLDWTTAGLVGAALAPTDPAVVFSVLGRREVQGRSGTTLEGEAGVNDPAGIAVMLGMIELATHDGASALVVVREFVVEMSVGAALGIAGGFAIVQLLRRLRLPSEGLYPVFALILAGLLYSGTAIAYGSGFLAVFLAGMVLGDARVPYKGEIERFQGSLASLAELVVFVALGATVRVSQLSGRDWLEGLVLFGALAVAIRPAVVAATLARMGFSTSERAFIAWSGLKGAVPILLAAFAILGGAPGASHVYELVFVVVLLSVVVQGSLVPYVAGRLRIPMRQRDRLPWELSVRVGEEPTEANEFQVEAGSAADGARIEDLPIGDEAWVTLVVRDGVAIQPGASLELIAGDRLLVLVDPDDAADVARPFRERAELGGT